MKRFSTIGVMLLTLGAFLAVSSISYAGESSLAKGDKAIDGKQSHSKFCCVTGAGHAAGKECTPKEKAACAAKLGLTPEECEKFCKSGDFEFVSMSIKGMTCGGCENTISTVLGEVTGVVRVGNVSHKDGCALVVINPGKANVDDLVIAVNGKGYKAEIIPAVVAHEAEAEITKTGAKPTCSKAAQAACFKPCSKTCSHKKTEVKTEGTK